MVQTQSNRIEIIDALRGMASLAVCWFHLTNGNPSFLPDGFWKQSGAWGWAGVEVFFVISGFIIPFTLWQSGYRLRNYSRFILKRVIRLDPPYLLSILLVIALAYISLLYPGFKGKPPSYSLTQIALHLGFINVFFGYPWINVVYWSLALEFQYYLLIGLIFPLLVSKNVWIKFVTMAVLLLSGFCLGNDRFVFAWLPLFLVGVLVFYCKAELMQKSFVLGLLVVLVGYIWLKVGNVIGLIVLLTAVAILLVKVKHRVLRFFGDISYSLYLVHVPIGGRVINLSLRHADSMPEKIASLAIALAISLAAAYLFYRVVELPSRKWASSIRYGAA